MCECELIKKYRSDFDILNKNNVKMLKCTMESCKNILKKVLVREKKFSNDLLKHNTSFHNKLNKDMSKLQSEFLSDKKYIAYINADDANKKKLHKSYHKLEKKILKKKMKLYNLSIKKFLNENIKIYEEFAYSKEMNDLRECNFNLCSKITRKGLILQKDLFKKICEETKNKMFCKLHYLSKDIDFGKITASNYIKYYFKILKIRKIV